LGRKSARSLNQERGERRRRSSRDESGRLDAAKDADVDHDGKPSMA
jgi:hypothetical protein